MNNQEAADRIELRTLVENYATESDKSNHDYYREIFDKNIDLQVYFYGKLGMDIHNVDDMVCQYKAFGAAKESFHVCGQQTVEFQDETHATGICYGQASLINEKDGKNILTQHAIRYYDTYEKKDGRWWIVARKQYFLFTTNTVLG